MKVGRVAIITRGRYAGKKDVLTRDLLAKSQVVIVQPNDTGSKAHPFPYAIVAGIERYPLKVTRRMGKKMVEKRSRIKPFIKVVNYNHLMPTRYTLELEGLKGAVSQETFKEVSTREDAKKTVKKALEDRYTSGKNRWFFTPLQSMPHAQNGTMGEPSVNGEKVHSHFLDHLTSYPVVSDSITVLKSNKYAAKSLEYADQGYVRIAKPLLPYLSKPYGYVAPYVAQVDNLGDQGLTKLDSSFPIIKEDTDKIKGTIYDTAFFPVRLAVDVKSHVFETFGSEYKKCGGDGMVAGSKAAISTSLILSQESLAYISSFLQKKKTQAKEAVNDKTN
ncbi:hypothetical protein CNMCM6936_006067 [Aspergillus lentulus]|nr:hypothetical protein CNMCM6936_006067 [Aspergillus lentulus]